MHVSYQGQTVRAPLQASKPHRVVHSRPQAHDACYYALYWLPWFLLAALFALRCWIVECSLQFKGMYSPDCCHRTPD